MLHLTLRSEDDDLDVDLLSGGPAEVRLSAERIWIFEGAERQLASIRTALGGRATQVARAVLRVNFGNSVGVFHIAGLPPLVVSSEKFEERHFWSMLDDIVAEAPNLPFKIGTEARLPYDRTKIADERVLYAAFTYLRRIFSSTAPLEVRISCALEAIVREPHRRFKSVHTRTPLDRVSRPSARTWIDAASDPRLQRVDCLPRNRLSVALGHCLPERLTESTVVDDFDTEENRFVLAFLRRTESIINSVRGGAKESLSGTARERVLCECNELEAALGRFLRAALWTHVKPMARLGTGSTVLQGRRGYRDVYRHFIRLNLSPVMLPFDARTTRDLLESKDIALLYEVWCFYMVIKATRSLLGEPRSAVQTQSTVFDTSLARGIMVEWPGHNVQVGYNVTFGPNGKHRSYSQIYRPDIAIFLGNDVVHVLDAKFKCRLGDGLTEDGAAESRSAGHVQDDIGTMHTYRDAICNARSAWVLFPGTMMRRYPEAPDDARVGAIPLMPRREEHSELREVLSMLLRPARTGNPAPPNADGQTKTGRGMVDNPPIL